MSFYFFFHTKNLLPDHNLLCNICNTVSIYSKPKNLHKPFDGHVLIYFPVEKSVRSYTSCLHCIILVDLMKLTILMALDKSRLNINTWCCQYNFGFSTTRRINCCKYYFCTFHKSLLQYLIHFAIKLSQREDVDYSIYDNWNKYKTWKFPFISSPHETDWWNEFMAIGIFCCSPLHPPFISLHYQIWWHPS